MVAPRARGNKRVSKSIGQIRRKSFGETSTLASNGRSVSAASSIFRESSLQIARNSDI